MDALFGDKHGEAALAEMIAEREAWLDKRYSMPSDAVKVLALPDKVPQKEVARLTQQNAANNTSFHEAEAAAAWQKATGNRLEVFDLDLGKGVKQPDFLIEVEDTPREQWQTLDFMYTWDADDLFKIGKLNDSIIRGMERQIAQIESHLQKADIVPLDFRRLNAVSRHKILEYVLSLPKEQRDRIRLLVDKSK